VAGILWRGPAPVNEWVPRRSFLGLSEKRIPWISTTHAVSRAQRPSIRLLPESHTQDRHDPLRARDLLWCPP